MKFIGIDVHKRIWTAVVIDENDKTIDEMIDYPTTPEGLDCLIEKYSPDECRIVFENLTRAHFVFHYLYDRGYAVDVAHTGHGSIKEIAGTNYKSDNVDACKLAYLCKDIWSGRKFIRRSHISSDENMKLKAIVRMNNKMSTIVDDMNLSIQEYMELHNIPQPKYKDVRGQKYRKYLLDLKDPAITMMVNTMTNAIDQMEYAKSELDKFAQKSEDIRLLMTIRGISVVTAATIVTAIDGIYRFENPDKLASFFGLGLTRSESSKNEGSRRITKEGDPLVRKYLANAVMNLTKWCPDCDVARSFKSKKDRMPHWKATTAAMRKLVCVIWAMLTKKQSFIFHPNGVVMQ